MFDFDELGDKEEATAAEPVPRVVLREATAPAPAGLVAESRGPALPDATSAEAVPALTAPNGAALVNGTALQALLSNAATAAVTPRTGLLAEPLGPTAVSATTAQAAATQSAQTAVAPVAASAAAPTAAPAAVPAVAPAASPTAAPTAATAAALVAPPPAAGDGQPEANPSNARYRPGMVLESVGAVIVRQAEDLDSTVVCRLVADSHAEVLAIGTGPSGKRVRVRILGQAEAVEGWVSVIAKNTAPLWRQVKAQAAKTKEDGEAERQHALEDARRKVEERPKVAGAQARQHNEGKPTARFAVGETWRAVGPMVVREKELLSASHNPVIKKLEVDSEIQVVQIGVDASGKRILIRDSEGLEGWVSVVNADGQELLKPVVRKEPELFTGAGQALGGTGSPTAADPRAAALAAAERRQQTALTHGVGEAKAKALKEKEQRDTILKKLGEIYAKRREEVPIAMQTASLALLQKHLDHLQDSPPPAAPAPAAVARAAAPPQPQPQFGRGRPEDGRPAFQPPARTLAVRESPQEPLPCPAAGPAPLGQQHVITPAEERRQLMLEARGLGLTERQMQAVLDLEALGFNYRQALEAYLACERNQELAANFLFETPVAEDEAPEAPMLGGHAEQPVEEVSLALREWEAVQRLEELGFDRPASLRAFLECGKDEEMAGNLLLM